MAIHLRQPAAARLAAARRARSAHRPARRHRQSVPVAALRPLSLDAGAGSRSGGLGARRADRSPHRTADGGHGAARPEVDPRREAPRRRGGRDRGAARPGAGGRVGRRPGLARPRNGARPPREAALLTLRAPNLAQGMVKIVDDPRVTLIGSWLRRFSLDELPQLWNVVRGDMSLVGPRPHQIGEVSADDDGHRQRLAMRPGLTGLWQVKARTNPSLAVRVYYDLEYIPRSSASLG